ncbi:hypothetical protein BLNAU_3249 [Blattamonas nauphoetae]|uniref:Uncharacterized protein n=1 Tax=Blattamonas nauphoetae TaxID=2049346 RepID=A0ABQ9YDG4_9EUKA|nr:hypothetical protein BLNAU_3249 [Blattamonas nauphoetae]
MLISLSKGVIRCISSSAASGKNDAEAQKSRSQQAIVCATFETATQAGAHRSASSTQATDAPKDREPLQDASLSRFSHISSNCSVDPRIQETNQLLGTSPDQMGATSICVVTASGVSEWEYGTAHLELP